MVRWIYKGHRYHHRIASQPVIVQKVQTSSPFHAMIPVSDALRRRACSSRNLLLQPSMPLCTPRADLTAIDRLPDKHQPQAPSTASFQTTKAVKKGLAQQAASLSVSKTV